MVFCGVCKQNKETKNRWTIREHAADNSILKDFKICDSCAAMLLRKIIKNLEPDTGPTISLTRTGLIDSIVLSESDELEITLAMDLAKARKVIEESMEQNKADSV